MKNNNKVWTLMLVALSTITTIALGLTALSYNNVDRRLSRIELANDKLLIRTSYLEIYQDERLLKEGKMPYRGIPKFGGVQ